MAMAPQALFKAASSSSIPEMKNGWYVNRRPTHPVNSNTDCNKMRYGRAKAARKTLKFYSLNANIKAPYKVILDGNFLAATVKHKVPIIDRLEKLLQGNEFSIYTTRSALDELNSLPGDIFQEARRFGLDECIIIERKDVPTGSNRNSDSSSSSPKEDIENLVGEGNNKEGYFVATQDDALSNKIRKEFVNVPQMRLARGVLLLESPSANSRRHNMREEREKQSTGGWTMTKDEKELIDKLKKDRMRKRREEEDAAAAEQQKERKKRKAKGPNPLSCKKKKTGDGGGDQKPAGGKTRRRRKKKSETLATSETS